MSYDATPMIIFDENSQHVESNMFYIPPGWVAQFLAFGFSDTPKVIDTDNPAKTLQAACMNMLLFKDVELPIFKQANTPVRNLSEYKGQLMAKELIITNGCPWRLDYCNNLALLDISGSYQLILNDPEAASVVRIFARFHRKEELSRNSGLYFGGVQ